MFIGRVTSLFYEFARATNDILGLLLHLLDFIGYAMIYRWLHLVYLISCTATNDVQAHDIALEYSLYYSGLALLYKLPNLNSALGIGLGL